MADDMARVTFGEGIVVIDGNGPYRCEVEIRQEVEMVRSDLAAKPDAQWEHTDSRGHFHAFAADGTLPTVRKDFEHVPCDGACGFESGCEGYDRPIYECLICSERVEPRYVPDHAARTVGVPVEGPKSAIITLHTCEALPEKKISLRVTHKGGEMIGIGDLRLAEWDGERGATYEVRARTLEPRMAA